MQERIRKDAARVRGLREVAGIRPGQLARELKVSEREYRAFASGGADIPLGVLCAMAGRFNHDLSAVLIDGHEVLPHPGDRLYFDASASHTLRAAGTACARVLAVVL